LTGSGGFNAFTINPSSGLISVNAGTFNLDFETKSTYSIVVEVTDLGGLKASATFTVRLTNVNEAPYWATALPVLSAKAAVLQTLKPALGAPYAADQDLNVTATGDGLTFSIVSGNLPGYFGINPVSGEISVLVTTLQSGSNFNLGIRIQDRGINGAQLSNTTSVTVTVVDNILSPFFASPTYTISVSENSAYLASVGTAIAANHPTLPQTLTYLIERQETTMDSAVQCCPSLSLLQQSRIPVTIISDQRRSGSGRTESQAPFYSTSILRREIRTN